MNEFRVDTHALTDASSTYLSACNALSFQLDKLCIAYRELLEESECEQAQAMLGNAIASLRVCISGVKTLAGKCEAIADTYEATENEVSIIVGALSGRPLFSGVLAARVTGANTLTSRKLYVQNSFTPGEAQLISSNKLPCEDWVADRIANYYG